MKGDCKMSKNRLKGILCMTLALPLLAMSITACSESGGQNEPGASNSTVPSGSGTDQAKQVTLSFLSAWNGGGAVFPQDQTNNPVSQRLREKTGVTLKMESITTSEV